MIAASPYLRTLVAHRGPRHGERGPHRLGVQGARRREHDLGRGTPAPVRGVLHRRGAPHGARAGGRRAAAVLERLGPARTAGLLPIATGLGGPGRARSRRASPERSGCGPRSRSSPTRSIAPATRSSSRPVPAREKRAVKPIIDVGASRVGDFLGAGLVQVAVVILGLALAPVVVLVLSIAASIAAASVAFRLHAGYLRTLERGLVARAVHVDLALVQDAATRSMVLQNLGSLRSSVLLASLGPEFRGEAPAARPIAVATGDGRAGAPTRSRSGPPRCPPGIATKCAARWPRARCRRRSSRARSRSWRGTRWRARRSRALRHVGAPAVDAAGRVAVRSGEPSSRSAAGCRCVLGTIPEPPVVAGPPARARRSPLRGALSLRPRALTAWWRNGPGLAVSRRDGVRGRAARGGSERRAVGQPAHPRSLGRRCVAAAGRRGAALARQPQPRARVHAARAGAAPPAAGRPRSAASPPATRCCAAPSLEYLETLAAARGSADRCGRISRTTARRARRRRSPEEALADLLRSGESIRIRLDELRAIDALDAPPDGPTGLAPGEPPVLAPDPQRRAPSHTDDEHEVDQRELPRAERQEARADEDEPRREHVPRRARRTSRWPASPCTSPRAWWAGRARCAPCSGASSRSRSRPPWPSGRPRASAGRRGCRSPTSAISGSTRMRDPHAAELEDARDHEELQHEPRARSRPRRSCE